MSGVEGEAGRESAMLGTFDVGIVGAGVVGLMTAFRLSKLGLKLAVFEKESGPGLGVTKGQASVVHVVQLPFGSLKSRLARLGNKQYDALCSELGVPLVRLPALLVVQGVWRTPVLLGAYLYLWWSLHSDFSLRVARGKTLRSLEPCLSDSISAGVVVEGYGVVDWQALVNRLSDRLGREGTSFFFDTEITGSRTEGPRVILETREGEYACSYAVNAAGLYSDEVAGRMGLDYGDHVPGLGAMAEFSDLPVKNIVAPLPIRPAKRTKGGAIIPTTQGTVIFGPTLREIKSKEASELEEEDLRVLTGKFGPLLKCQGKLIRMFSGVRPISPTGDFVIEYSAEKRVVSLIGIESPGLTASPAIADRVIDTLVKAGLTERFVE